MRQGGRSAIAEGEVRLASRAPDGGASAPGLIRHHLHAGRPCFALFTEAEWVVVGAQLGEVGVSGRAVAELGELQVFALGISP